jgi:O-antigen ligase
MVFLIVLGGIVGLCWAGALAVILVRRMRIGDVLPLGCLGVIICGSVLGHPFFNVNVGPLPITLDRILWVMLLATCVLLVVYRWSTFTEFDRIDLLVYGLLILIAMGTFAYDWQYKEQLPFRRLIFLNVMPVGLYWVARQATFNERQIKMCFWIFACLGFYLALTGIFEWRHLTFAVLPRYISSEQFTEFLGRARGPFLNPVVNGIFMCVSLAGSMLMWPHAKGYGKWIIALTLPVYLLGLYATLTRSIWITAVGTLLVTVWLPSSRAWKGLMICGGTMAAILVVAMFATKFNSFKRDKYVTAEEMSESVSLRPMLAFVAAKMVKDRPFFGHGFGQYTAAKKPYHYNKTNQMELRKILPYMQHNVFLSYLTELGIAGCSLLVLLLVTTSWKAWSLWHHTKLRLAYRQAGLMFLVISGAYILNGMFHDVSIIPMCNTLLLFLVGMLANVSARADRSNRDTTLQRINYGRRRAGKHEYCLAA